MWCHILDVDIDIDIAPRRNFDGFVPPLLSSQKKRKKTMDTYIHTTGNQTETNVASSSTHSLCTPSPSPSPSPPPRCSLCGSVLLRRGDCSSRCTLRPDCMIHTPPGKKHRVELLFKALAAGGASISSPPPMLSSNVLSSVDMSPCMGVEVIPCEKVADLVLLRSPNPIALFNFIQQSELLDRHFDAIYLTKDSVKDSEEEITKWIQQQLLTLNHKREQILISAPSSSIPPLCFRLCAYPSTFRSSLIQYLPSVLPLHPRHHTHVLFAVRPFNNKLFMGIEEREKADVIIKQINPKFAKNKPTSQSADEEKTDSTCAVLSASTSSSSPPSHIPASGAGPSISRAYFKLSESFLLDSSLSSTVRAGSTCVDIGASPGGWSYCLRERGCRVLAIDPGIVKSADAIIQCSHEGAVTEDATRAGISAAVESSSAVSSGFVVHCPSLVESSYQAISTFSSLAPISLIVCDANMMIFNVVDILRKIGGMEGCLSADARLVLTVKETIKGRSKMLVRETICKQIQGGTHSVALVLLLLCPLWLTSFSVYSVDIILPGLMSDYFTHPRVYHLLSNGDERTLVADYIHVTQTERIQLTRERDIAHARRQEEWQDEVKRRDEKEKARKAAAASVE